MTPQLRDAKAERQWPAITTHNQNNHSVRTERWRYIRYADGSEELYDRAVDPNEWDNLARDSKNAATIRELAAARETMLADGPLHDARPGRGASPTARGHAT